MNLKLKVENGKIELPEHLHVPNGTEVLLQFAFKEQGSSREFRFPTYRGDGPHPGIDLSDTSKLFAILDAETAPRIGE